MEKAVKLKIFVLLAGCVFFIFGFSIFGAKAYGALFSDKTVPEGVIVSGVDLSGLTEEKAAARLDDAIKSWREKSFYFLQADKELTLDLTLMEFDVKRTAKQALENKTEAIAVNMNEAAFTAFLQTELPAEILHAVDRKALSAEIEAASSELIEGIISINLDEYYLKEKVPKTIIASTSLQNESFILENPLTLTIEPKQTFSLASYIETEKMQDFDDATLKWIATGIYQTILSANFEIVERHISQVLPAYAELGKEASFTMGKQDFIFYNPNDTIFEVKLTQDASSLLISLEGLEFEKSYSLTMENEKNYKPKKIIQFDSALAENTTRVEEEGIEGKSISVYRNELDQEGNIVSTEFISDDYYAPVHRIEKTALKAASEESSAASVEGETPPSNQADSVNSNPNQNSNSDQAKNPSEASNGALSPDQTVNSSSAAPVSAEDHELWEEPAFEKGER
ncbi:VanW family protein [Peribacillus frigoritolerans]|uniref:VanW family protein n=1 Tax=Peribacillus frigoritolerans TaxID=450367 RepID=UPI00105988F6|nr:VanW family protein [Peribacillus frigoritolerans]TDL82139.1 hypothetical protein E2R53_00715 [Peribacillus frigoritolerans]